MTTNCSANANSAIDTVMHIGIVGTSRQIATSIVTAKIVSTMLSARKTRRPIPSPIGTVTPGARNFKGVSKNEIAKSIPSHTKTIETATADSVVKRGSIAKSRQ